TRRERAHGRVEVHERRAVVRLEPGFRTRVLVPDLHLRARAARGRRPRDPVHLLDARDRRLELALAADHDAVALGIERGDVEPLRGRDPEAAPLADRVVMDPAVATEHAALAVDDLALARQR